MPNNKSKGSKVERELFQMFISEGTYRVVRVAGSGTMENADCDLLAGKKGKKFAIEVKSSKKPIKYISKEQIDRFVTFSEIFKLYPVIALRFNREGWFFIHPKEMKKTQKNWSINLEQAKKKGKRFTQFFSSINKKSKSKTNSKNKTKQETDYDLYLESLK
ncbi:MAG: Holliday junction resolvase Hjc [Nanoarchaeota archaeon]